MKQGIHPKYFPNAKVICSCGNTWTTGSTREVIHTDVCSNCHPFYTGEQRIVDTEGQVDRFYKKLEARSQYLSEKESRDAAKATPQLSIAELQLGTRPEAVLRKAGLETVAQVLDRLALGDEAILSIEGFGQKSLIDLKKKLRSQGLLTQPVELPAAETAEPPQG